MAAAETAGLYTASCSCTEKFEDIQDVRNYKVNKNVPGDGKVQQARYITEHIPCPKEVEDILQWVFCRLGK